MGYLHKTTRTPSLTLDMDLTPKSQAEFRLDIGYDSGGLSTASLMGGSGFGRLDVGAEDRKLSGLGLLGAVRFGVLGRGE